ncbi:AAA family ATPase [Staphylococcus caprae]|uniref:AAA family ATPase n=1 Tax=Staphylococcus caprae TaxID=29380 RepID=UPI000E6A5803|nr:AAA family ATPase [Staphylococcus caprae]MBU5271848.1 AAA family ATPase [Staphylococcus caprae]MDK6296462.1 AAA family ATPase [Staphylococcus caprae]MDK7231765.1 AAA family ATPase [Staphylococcus caprae]RIM34601.1 ATP/GTP-binding protein [Staphylococcus caprae]
MKIAISGTYSTGKTTTTLALHYYTGICKTHAKTMREILPIALPGKTLENATGPELIQLGIRRLLERAISEAKLSEFISDGSSLHEWVYGITRTNFGLNPNLNNEINILSEELKFFKDIMLNFGEVAKEYAKSTYDCFIQLPIEFPLVEDGHRPVSEAFRESSNSLLINTINELKIPMYVVDGSIQERILKIVEILGLQPITSIDKAINMANRDMKNFILNKE